MSPPYTFSWPNQDQEQYQEQYQGQYQAQDQSPDDVVTTVKHVIATFVNNTGTTVGSQQSAITEKSTVPSVVVGNTFQTQTAETTTENILTTVTDSISTTVRNVITTVTNGFNLTENTGSNNTAIASNNSTVVVTEILGNNGTMEETGSTMGTLFEETSTEPSTVTEVINSIFSTTDDIITSSVTDTTLTDQTSLLHTDDHMYHDEPITVYVILGVLLGILILTFIALLLFYKKYKKCRQMSGNYCVTQLKEISSTSSIKTASDSAHMNVKH